MKVHKFGGASVKDSTNVKNLGHILKSINCENSLIIASAMGKTTNALEVVVKNYFEDKNQIQSSLQIVKDFHHTIISDLFSDYQHPIYTKIESLFDQIDTFILNNKSPNYNFVYDQIVSYGELFSTTILHHYLEDFGIQNIWTDARDLIKTDTTYRDAIVDWELTNQNISNHINSNQLFITQGFIGSDSNGFSTTLGREGSDYTAAIFGNILKASSVTIWKDVPGVLNADPRYFNETILLKHISYQEAIELAFYGASVIHPKTLQPLQNKRIPLFVKSFLNPELDGTEVSSGVALSPQVPCFIVKKEQLLISLATKDFSFIMEQNISDIFKLFHLYHIRVNVIQNSAISFSVCVEDKFNNFEQLREQLTSEYKVSYNEKVSLYTIRHFESESLDKVLQDKTLLLKQVNRETMQVVTKE